MNIFDLFGNPNVSELLNCLSKDTDDVVVNKLDFTKKEDLDKLLEAVDTFKNADSGLLGMVKTFVGDSFNDTLDIVVNAAKEEYANAHKNDVVNTRKEIDKSTLGVGSPIPPTPVRPSDKTPEEIQNKLVKLVQEYVSEKIKPTAKLTEEQLTSVSDGLFEFACWIYNH